MFDVVRYTMNKMIAQFTVVSQCTAQSIECLAFLQIVDSVLSTVRGTRYCTDSTLYTDCWFLSTVLILLHTSHFSMQCRIGIKSGI